MSLSLTLPLTFLLVLSLQTRGFDSAHPLTTLFLIPMMKILIQFMLSRDQRKVLSL